MASNTSNSPDRVHREYTIKFNNSIRYGGRLYNAIKIINEAIVGEFEDAWQGALKDHHLTKHYNSYKRYERYADTYDIINALQNKGDKSSLEVATKMKEMADSFKYSEEVAACVKRARKSTGLCGFVDSGPVQYFTPEEVCSESVLANLHWSKEDVELWFPSYRLAVEYWGKRWEEQCKELGLSLEPRPPLIRQETLGYMSEEDSVVYYIQRIHRNEQEIRELKALVEKQEGIIKELLSKQG